MLRMKSEEGWWLITHPDHARLAGAFASAWGNAVFRRPEPRERVLFGITAHDDGWSQRDAHPKITREGKPSAFSIELVGKYSAFEEIDLVDYLRVRERAVRMIAERDAYAGMLIAKHTYSLLTDHADRATIAADQLPLLEEFLEAQRQYQLRLMRIIEEDTDLTVEDKSHERIEEHFRLLQACDNLSLLSCVGYDKPGHLLHPLPLTDGRKAEVTVMPLGLRVFQLKPWPFEEIDLVFEVPARHVVGNDFSNSEELEAEFFDAKVEMLQVRLVAGNARGVGKDEANVDRVRK